MRSPRAVEDYHVDRRQVEGRRRPSRAVLIARACSFAVFLFFLFNLSHDIRRARRWPVPRRRDEGGNGGGVPPLPIPNREVKPACADGTAERRESRRTPVRPVPGLSRAASRSGRACPVILQGAFLRIIVMNYLIISGLWEI